MFVVAAGVEFAETTPDVDVHAGTSTSSHAEARILQNDVEPASTSKDRPSMTDLQTALQEAFAVECLETAKNECVVCLSGEPVMALMPCGHRCACAECGPMLETCPLCRTAVQEAKRIFG